MTFEEFRKSIIGKNNQRPWLIRNSYNTYDIYKYMRKNGWQGIGKPVTEHQFYTIVKTLNQYLADLLSEGKEVKIPYLGHLEILKYSNFVAWKNGKLVTNYPINWGKTLRLWYEDEEAFKNKSIIRRENKESFIVHWNNTHLKFTNKKFFLFRASRGLKRKLMQNVNKGKIDAFLTYKQSKR